MIVRGEIKMYRSVSISDGNSNGGLMSSVQVVSGSAKNLFPQVSESEREEGITRYRKFFIKIANDDDLTANNSRVYLDRYTLGDDIVTFFAGTQTDTQAEIDEDDSAFVLYGAGQLAQNVSAGDIEIDVSIEDQDLAQVFREGMTIRISDRTDIDDPTNSEFGVIDSIVEGSDNLLTITLVDQLQNSYSAVNTRVGSVYIPSPEDIATSFSDEVVTTAGSGDYNFASLLGDNIGGIEQTWTLTWSNANTFSVSGNTVGAVGSFNISGGAAPNNSAFGKPFFNLQSAGFSGVYALNDTIVFKSHPAAIPAWAKQIVPPGSAANSGNKAVFGFTCETA